MLIEHYRPSTNMAACGWDMNNADKNSCTAGYDQYLDNGSEDSFFQLFTDLPNCTVKEKEVVDLCYFTGAESSRVFTS